jgi:hypothetical protein
MTLAGACAAPVLATGDGALGFWAALREVFPQARVGPVLVPLRRPRDYADLVAGAAGGRGERAGKIGIIRPC